MPQARAVPQPPPAPTPNIVTTQSLTARDVAALRGRAEELSTQIRSASSRRADARNALRNATGVDKVGIEQRLAVLDARIAGLEADIADNGKQLASLDAMRAGVVDPGFSNAGRGRRMDNNMVPMVIVFTLFVLCPIALSISRFFWKVGSAKKHAPQNPENTQRLERMEQAIDSIAIEMERVSEGQRFVTRILSEGGRSSNAIGGAQQPGQSNPIAQGERLGIR